MRGSRQFEDFLRDYQGAATRGSASLKQTSMVAAWHVAPGCDQYLHDRLTLLETQLRHRQPHGAGQRAAGRRHRQVGA